MEKPKHPEPNIRPSSLAEKLAAKGHECKIPFTHDRLHEVHYWWHQMALAYHEPEPFRYSLGAFIQAGRSVTYALQKEKAIFKDFSWYEEWVKEAKSDKLLKWLHDTRNNFVHKESLQPHSWMEMDCIFNSRSRPRRDDDDDEGDYHGPLVGRVDPFLCTHTFLAPMETDHCHRFTRSWEMEELPGREILEACADIYDRLDGLLMEAHSRLGETLWSYKTEISARALPCMRDTMKYRVTETVMRDGREVWDLSREYHHH